MRTAPGITFWMVSLAVVSWTSSATAGDPAVLHPVRRPPSVPAEYVLTHRGFVHPSCVVSIASGDAVGEDLVVRGEDGVEHQRLAPCVHPWFTARGERMDAGVFPHRTTWDGWLVYYQDDQTIPIASGSTLTTEWVVPPVPANAAGQDVAFFDDIETTSGGGDILQPVLDFGEREGVWIITSEHQGPGSNDVQSTPVVVDPGDLIRGEVSGQGCDDGGACQAWTITATDVTSGQRTVLHTTAPNGVPRRVSPAVLEAYDVRSCDMLPPSGHEVFGGSALLDAQGSPQPLHFTLGLRNATPGDVPECGYRGSAGSHTFQLVFSDAVGASWADDDLHAPPGCECRIVGATPGACGVPAVLVALLGVASCRAGRSARCTVPRRRRPAQHDHAEERCR